MPHPTAATVQILCVAADRGEVEFVRDELMKRAQDFNVEASCTLQDAIARVEDPLRYDAVLFDLHLQGGGALSELTQLGELDGGPAVIMMGDEERYRKAFPAADAYVVKDQDYLVRLPVVVQEVLPRWSESVVSCEALRSQALSRMLPRGTIGGKSARQQRWLTGRGSPRSGTPSAKGSWPLFEAQSSDTRGQSKNGPATGSSRIVRSDS